MHVIRLGRRWELLHDGASAGSGADRHGATLVEEICLPASSGQLGGSTSDIAPLLRRTFHRPTGIGQAQRVLVAIDSSGLDGAVWLNGTRLGALRSSDGQTRWDITELLRDRNRLTLELVPGLGNHDDVRAIQSVVLQIIDGDEGQEERSTNP